MARKPAQAALPAAENGVAYLSESEARVQRYNTIQREADDFGRIIGVRRLKPSEQTKLQGMTADLTGHDEATDEDTGETVHVPHRLPLFIAASVREITTPDGNTVYVTFPKTRAELDSIYDRLDQEGVAAASRAFAKLSADTPVDTVAEAKN